MEMVMYIHHHKILLRKRYDLKILNGIVFDREGGSMSSNLRIDEVDITIIRALQKDARINFSSIARDCGVSIDTISKRFVKMKKAGVVKGTTILLNPKSFGYECVGSLGVDINYPHSKEVVESLLKIPEIIFCTTSMGKHDIFCIVVLKNVGLLSKVKDLIKRHPAVREVTTHIWVDEILLCPENFEFKHLERQ